MKKQEHVQKIDFPYSNYVFNVLSFLAGIYTQEDLHEFLREAEIMQSFNHDNVVKLLGRCH